MTKRLNALALETENRNSEWRRCESQLVKRAGYNKTVSTKNAITIKKGMEKFGVEKVLQNDKISLPLIIFDNIKENIESLNRFNSFENIKVILCAVLTIIITPIEKRSRENSSNHAISNLLGLNNKSMLMKHVFEKSESLLTTKKLPRGSCTVGMVESSLAPIVR
jgi:hypothetical protein